MLWYSFQRVNIYFSTVGTPSSVSFKAVCPIDDKISQHAWLKHLYEQLLESTGATDPFYPHHASMRLYKRMEVPSTKCLVKSPLGRVLIEGPVDYATSVLGPEGGAFMMGITHVSCLP